MLFNASFSPIGERLRNASTTHSGGTKLPSPTLAISPQLFPASLIIFSRCSSDGVHGVFVLLFFGACSWGDISAASSPSCPVAPGSPSAVEDIPDIPETGAVPGALRFLEVDGGELA